MLSCFNDRLILVRFVFVFHLRQFGIGLGDFCFQIFFVCCQFFA